MITLDDYLMGRTKISPLTEQMRMDSLSMVDKTNRLLSLFGSSRKVSSGYRPELINSTIKNAALHSNHIICRAVDLEDHDGRLDFFCMTHQDDLIRIGLWLEDPRGTPGWCHVQIVSPASHHRVFMP